MLHLAQQEILARRGAKVEDIARRYFEYRGWYADTGFDPAGLSDIERKNMAFLRAEEEAQARRWAWVKKVTADYDIDGDGRKDDVSFTVAGSDIHRATLACGKAKLSMRTDHVDGYVAAMWIVDIDESDGVREVAIALGGARGKTVTFYRLGGDRWRTIGSIERVEVDVNNRLEPRLDGKGTVWFRQTNDDSDLSAAWTPFALGKRGFEPTRGVDAFVVNMRLIPAERPTGAVTLVRSSSDATRVGTASTTDDMALLRYERAADGGVWWEMLRADGVRGWARREDAMTAFRVVDRVSFDGLEGNHF